MLTAGDVYEVSLSAVYRSSRLYNVEHVQLRVNRTAAQLQADCQTFADAWKEIFRANQSDGFTWGTWTAKQVAGAGVTYDPSLCKRSGGDVYGAPFSGTLTGAVTGVDFTPSFTAICVSERTGLIGRSKNGRSFVGGWPETRVTGDNFEPANLATINTNLATHVAAYGQAGTNPNLAWVIFAAQVAFGCKYVAAIPKPVYQRFTAPSPATASTVILTAVANLLLTPMHRRKAGVGI